MVGSGLFPPVLWWKVLTSSIFQPVFIYITATGVSPFYRSSSTVMIEILHPPFPMFFFYFWLIILHKINEIINKWIYLRSYSLYASHQFCLVSWHQGSFACLKIWMDLLFICYFIKTRLAKSIFKIVSIAAV
jgi:hypothetical protein